jgi:hypothetical protein
VSSQNPTTVNWDGPVRRLAPGGGVEIHHFLADVDPKTGYLPD